MKRRPKPPIGIIAIGSSTGGVEVLRQLIPQLNPTSPPVVIAQHIPKMFTESMAKDLEKLSQLTVCEAKMFELLEPGHCYICPGGSHIVVQVSSGKYTARTHPGRPNDLYKPTINLLMHSMANNLGSRGLGVILTGMGMDGARGLLEMHKRGACTIAQSEETCVVYGMPKAAVEMKAASAILPKEQIGHFINRVVAKRLSG